jgi:hypothetical protein
LFTYYWLKPACSCAACSLAIVSHFHAHCLDVEGYYNSEIAADIQCLVPFVTPPSIDDCPALLHRIFQLEYGFDISAELQHITLHEQSHSAEYEKQWCLEQKEKYFLFAIEDAVSIAANWTSVVPDDIVQSFVHDYYLGSQCKKIPTCAWYDCIGMQLKCLLMMHLKVLHLNCTWTCCVLQTLSYMLWFNRTKATTCLLC